MDKFETQYFLEWWLKQTQDVEMMETEELARKAFLAGMNASQQSFAPDACPVCFGQKGAFVDGHWSDCIHCLATGKRR